MTDQGPSTPPGMAPGFVPPPPPPRAGWVIPVVIVSAVALLGVAVAIAVGAAMLVGSIQEVTAAGPAEPAGDGHEAPVAGDPGEPVAEEPLDCTACYTYPDATVLRLGLDAYRAIGLTTADGHLYSATVGEEQGLADEAWAQSGGDPAECFFAMPQAPLAIAPGERSAATDDDRVHYPSWHSDPERLFWLTEGVRLFDDSTAATAYLAGLADAVDACRSYAMPAAGWSAAVAPAAALDLPPSVAAYGWVETGGLYRYYGVDLQRGNLVLRLTLSSAAGGPTETEFREFAESYAELLASLEPSG